MIGFLKNLFKSDIVTALDEFDGYLTNNTLAMKAAEGLVEKLEKAGYSKKRIKETIKNNMPKIIKLVQKNKGILDLAQETSDEVVDRNKTLDDMIEKVKNIKNDEESDEITLTRKELAGLIKEVEGKPVTKKEQKTG